MNNNFFALLASRLGLRFAPMGSNIQNIGVEDGAEYIAQFLEQGNTSMNTAQSLPNFLEQFEPPELLSEESYLQTIFIKYTSAKQKLLSNWSAGKTLITFGGDHSISYISLAAVLERYGKDQTAVLMFDSHADLNTDISSTTGNFHGMWLRPFFDSFEAYKLTHKKIAHEQLRYVGNLVLDDVEAEYIKKNKIKVYPSKLATHESAQELLEWTTSFPHLHISFDIDVFAQHLISATGTPNENGFEMDEIFIFLEAIKNHPSISFDIVEFNPHKQGTQQSLAIIQKVFATLTN